MKAIFFNEFGGSNVLQFGELITPQPGPDEIQIKIAYTGVNPVDWKIRSGLLKSRMPYEFPIIPGWDASGHVSAVGKNVKNFNVGDAVFAYCRTTSIKWGTYAEYICVPADSVALKPKNIGFAEAAAIPLSGLTAWQSLFDAAKLKKGETVLIHAGAGGVGSLAIQFAKNAGAHVITTATTPKHSYIKKLGAEHAIDYKTTNFIEEIKKIKPEGVDVVFDTMGGETLKNSYAVLKKNGRLVSIVEIPNDELAKPKQITNLYVFVNPNGKELHQIAELIETGKVRPPKIEELPLLKAAEAQEKNEQGHVEGKIVLKIS